MASACCMIFSMRICFLLCLCLCTASPALAQVAIFPAPSGKADAETLVVYSSLDEPLATPMIEGFQKANPDIAVHYEDMLTGEIYDRIVKETDAGKKPPISPFPPPWICR
ncbi:ABC transporter, substrate binding protein (Iron) (fragment) [Agrobacterium deltaense NCPPB 1641]|uniref:ABC transporter, substrate binding protein (Iron) n=1 Tax=Agrobacterium deltaense NCPPB 1641 TaxID=1183425 RepID=A0A1S7TKM0_9HYPH